MIQEIIEVTYFLFPDKPIKINITNIGKILGKNNYYQKISSSDTYYNFIRESQMLDEIHLGANGEFSRIIGLKPSLNIKNTIKDCFEGWKSTKLIHIKLLESSEIPQPADSVIILLSGKMDTMEQDQLINAVWKEFSETYFGIKANISISPKCSLLHLNFGKDVISNEELYIKIPRMIERFEKLDLLREINKELNLPQDDFGFNFKDSTISKLALAKILLGIKREKEG